MSLSTKELWPLLLATFSLLVPPRAVAQLGGEHLRGDYGMSPNGAKRTFGEWRVKVTRIIFLMLTALLSVSAAFAQQSGSGASTTDTDPYGWKVNWVPFYLWMSGLNGNVGVRGHVAPVDASFSDVLTS